MTKFEILHNMAYASQMQFEVLRRALWVQQVRPQTVFNWHFLEKAAQDPKTTAYLNHGVKAKMCETTPFVNRAHYVASRAQIEQACDSLRSQGQSLPKKAPPTTSEGMPAEFSEWKSLQGLVPDVSSQRHLRSFQDPLQPLQHIHLVHLFQPFLNQFKKLRIQRR